MKHIKLFIFLFICSLTSIDAATFRVATYNILNPVFEEKYSGISTWETRFPNIINNIVEADSDILCLEEIGMTNFQQIASHPEIAKRYISFFLPHHYPSKIGKDGLAFFYKPSRALFQQIVQSNVDTRPSSRRDFYVDIQALLPDTQSTTMRIGAIHLDSHAIDIGNKQLALLVNDALTPSSDSIDLVVICGDFNEGHKEASRPRYDFMCQEGFATDGSLIPTRPEDILDTHHMGHVDWIFFKNLSQKDYQFLAVDPIGDSSASDHKLTITDIEIH